jgi:hypothetical protein
MFRPPEIIEGSIVQKRPVIGPDPEDWLPPKLFNAALGKAQQT